MNRDLGNPDKPLTEGQREVMIGTIRVPLDVRVGQGETLVVLFHGGMKRDKRPFPFFQPFFPVVAHQMAISDPTMFADPSMPTGWYIGSEGEDLPRHLSALIRNEAARLGCARRIYIGGSAGGFAALMYARLDPGSIAIAANPQTRLQSYFIPSGVELFRRACWPSADSVAALARIAPIDVCAQYAQGFDNHVIYIQSAGDHDHVQGQMAPFLAAIDAAHADRAVFDVGYWGIPGHSGSAPPRAWLPWLRAALATPEVTSAALLETRHALAEQAATAPARPARPDPAAPDPADIRRADLLRNLELAKARG